MPDRWRAQLRHDGVYIATGDRDVHLDTWDGVVARDLGPGIGPKWYRDTQLLVGGHDEHTRLIDFDGVVVQDLGQTGANELAAADGRWAYAHGYGDVLMTSWGRQIPRGRMPALAGVCFAYVQLGATDDDLRTLRLDDGIDEVAVARGVLADPCVTAAGVVAWQDGRAASWGRFSAADPIVSLLVDPTRRESPPVLIVTPDGVWVLAHDDDRLLVRPWPRPGVPPHQGHQRTNAEVGATNLPHGVCVGRDLRIAWTDDAGELHRWTVSIDAPLEDLAWAPVTPPNPPAATRVTFSAPPEFAQAPPVPVVTTPGAPVRCEYRVTTGPEPAQVQWEAQRAGSIEVRVVVNPGSDHDHTFRLPAGDWAVTLRALDAAGEVLDQTGKPRAIMVKAPSAPVWPRQIGLCWPMPGGDPITLDPAWLAQYRDHGFSTVRLDVPVERDRANAQAAVQAVLDAGLVPLPILTWPYRHPNADDLVGYADWFLDRFPDLPWIELGNEPWIMSGIEGDVYLHCAAPMAERIESRTAATRVVLAYDWRDFNNGKDRRWPQIEHVVACIAASDRRYAALHPYRNPKPPAFSAWGTRQAEHQAICDSLGHARYLVTEVGWQPVEGASQADGTYHQQELQTHGGLGVQGVWIYVTIGHAIPSPEDVDFGLFGVDDQGHQTPRPAATALKAALPVQPPVTPPGTGNGGPDWPGPDPDLPTTTLQTSDGVHFVCAEIKQPDAPVNATRTAAPVGGFEHFGVVQLARDTVALQAANRLYASVQPDGRVLANGPGIGPWEPLQVIPYPNDMVALKAHTGRFGHAENGGGGSLLFDRDSVGEHELFKPSRLLIGGGSGFKEWPPALLQNMRGNWTSGPFIGATEAPGKTDVEQDWYLEQMIARGYQFCSVAIVNGSTGWAKANAQELQFGSRRWRARVEHAQQFGEAAPPGSPLLDHWLAYDGFREEWQLLERWLRKLAAAKIVPMLAPNQGAPASWRMICRKDIDYGGSEKLGYSNDWAFHELAAWARQVDAVMEGHWIWLMGYEVNETFPAFDGNPSHRGPGEKWGWNGISTHWAKTIKQTVPHVATQLHLTPNLIGPTKGAGGRDWTAKTYWENGHAGTDDGQNHFNGLAGQYELDENRPDVYYSDQTRIFLEAMAAASPARAYAALEYVRPWIGEAVAKHLAGIIRRAGCANLLNGD